MAGLTTKHELRLYERVPSRVLRAFSLPDAIWEVGCRGATEVSNTSPAPTGFCREFILKVYSTKAGYEKPLLPILPVCLPYRCVKSDH